MNCKIKIPLKWIFNTLKLQRESISVAFVGNHLDVSACFSGVASFCWEPCICVTQNSGFKITFGNGIQLYVNAGKCTNDTYSIVEVTAMPT